MTANAVFQILALFVTVFGLWFARQVAIAEQKVRSRRLAQEHDDDCCDSGEPPCKTYGSEAAGRS